MVEIGFLWSNSKIVIYDTLEIQNRVQKIFPKGENLSPGGFWPLTLWCNMISNKILYIPQNTLQLKMPYFCRTSSAQTLIQYDIWGNISALYKFNSVSVYAGLVVPQTLIQYDIWGNISTLYKFNSVSVTRNMSPVDDVIMWTIWCLALVRLHPITFCWSGAWACDIIMLNITIFFRP